MKSSKLSIVSKALLLCGCLSFAASTNAQTAATRANILTEINTNLPSGTGALTAANLRLTLKDIIASSYVPLTDGSPGVAGNLTAGSGIGITGTWPNLTIAYTGGGGGGGSGTVTSLALTVPSFLSVTGSPVTTSGTIALGYSGTPLPVANGGTGVTTPSLIPGTNVTISGTWPNQTINSTASGGGGGTVTSVGATVPAFLSVTGSPVTTTGTLAIGLSGTPLPVVNGGTGVTTPGLIQGANVTISGTWPNQTIAASASSGMTNPMTTAGDMVVGGASGAPARLPVGTNGQFLYIAGGAETWGTTGVVGSIGLTVPSFLSVTGSPLTANGTLAVSYSGTPLPVANGGTGTATPGIVAGTNTTVSGTWPNQTVNSTGANQTFETMTGFSAAGTTTTARPTASDIHTAYVTASTGAGAYTRSIVLNTTNTPVSGDALHLVITLPASSNPTIPIYSGSTGGTLLGTITNPSATPDTVSARYIYTGTNWQSASSASSRVKDYTTVATSTASDDYIPLDGATNGIRRILTQNAIGEEIGFGVDGGGSVVATGLKVKRVMQYAGTIVGWGIVADQSGSITMDIRKGTPSGGTVTTSTITASAVPALSSAQVATSTTLTGWTTTYNAGDVLELVITGSPATITNATITLKILR